MNFKGFLKPSWNKIILTIALLLYMAFLSIGYRQSPFGELNKNFGYYLNQIFLLPSTILLFIENNFLPGLKNSEFIPYTIIIISSILWSYLISCTIISIFKKK